MRIGLGRENVPGSERTVNAVDAFTLPDGSRVIRKTPRNLSRSISSKKEYDAEELVAPIARALGLHAPDVYRKDEKTLFVDYVENAKLADEVPGYRKIDLAKTPDGLRLGLLDLITFNGDRHNANWFVTDENRIVPIDHGATFQSAYATEGWALRPESPQTRFERNFVANPRGEEVDPDDVHHYGSGTGQWVSSHPISKASMSRIRKELLALKAQFVTKGREGWHAAMMERFEELAKRAAAKGVDI